MINNNKKIKDYCLKVLLPGKIQRLFWKGMIAPFPEVTSV